VADFGARRARRAGLRNPAGAVVHRPRAGADSARGAPQAFVDRPVAVVVDAVADLGARRARRARLQDSAGAVVDRARAGADPARREAEAVVDLAVAVVVATVALLRRARVDRRVLIVAVLAGGIPVVVEILAGIADAVGVGVLLAGVRQVGTVVADVAATVV